MMTCDQEIMNPLYKTNLSLNLTLIVLKSIYLQNIQQTFSSFEEKLLISDVFSSETKLK